MTALSTVRSCPTFNDIRQLLIVPSAGQVATRRADSQASKSVGIDYVLHSSIKRRFFRGVDSFPFRLDARQMPAATHNFRCGTCKSTSENPCNLVVFIDGTSNKFGPKNTNVVKLFRQVKVESEGSSLKQSKNYWSGIGSQSDGVLNHMGKKTNRLIEMAFAWNVENNVKDAYSWLVENYEKGAQIYLFGFSRGAYQVRVLAGLIHEVGLIKNKEHIEMACGHYRRIHTDERKAREMATDFKKTFCWPDVRIHFVGVWDTVSSVGLFKKDAFVSASASMTNACYFRHALALDERRVRFMPEYFVELNARNEMVNNAVNDHAKEVWFAGSHSDVGGRTRPDRILFSQRENEYLYHAGHVPLLWMRREASDKGLILNPEDNIWVPEDVSHGRVDSMTAAWWLFEVLPVRHQVSFSGAGKHKWRWHWFQPRRVIPNQKIHVSVLAGDEYTAHATLGNGIDIPIPLRKVLQRAPDDGLWATELTDEEAATRLLTSLLSDPNKMLDSLERVLFLLESKGDNNAWVQRMLDWPRSFEDIIRNHTGFPKLASIIIYFIASGFSITEDMAQDAGGYLMAVLSKPGHPDCPRALSLLRFLTRYPTLPLNGVLVSSVIQALKCAMEWSANSRNTSFFPLVLDSLCNLIDNDNVPAELIQWLCDGLHENGTAEPSHRNSSSTSRLSSILTVKAPTQLVASLRMIISLAQHQPDACSKLKPQLLELAKKETSSVGSVVVEALVALDPSTPLTLDLRFSNILCYLGNTLPHLDVENDTLPHVDVEMGQGNASQSDAFSGGKPELGDEVLGKLVSTAGSWNTRERTAAILTLLKLCGDWKTQKHIRSKALDVFVRQLRRKKTSLLATYALKTCLEHGMKEYIDLPQVAPLIVCMLKNGWFDDAVGRLEGFEIFRELMKYADLKREVMQLDMAEYLVKQLEIRKHHEVRPVLIVLDTLVGDERERLGEIVERGLDHLKSARRKIQSKGVKILSALAQTAAGEEVIRPHVTKIVEMLLPPGYLQAIALEVVPSPPSVAHPTPSIHPILHSQIFGPIAALYALSRNDELRREIKCSSRYASFRHLHHSNVLYKK